MNRQRGSATITILGIGVTLMMIAGSMATVAAVYAARHQARVAADMAALAAASVVWQGDESSCREAELFAQNNHAHLVNCVFNGSTVTTTVAIDLFPLPWRTESTSRAGPA